MKSVIIVGVHPHSTILLHQPQDGAGAASVNFYGRPAPEQIVAKALLFFGVHITPEAVREMERKSQPVPNPNMSYSYAVAGERCHSDATCSRMDQSSSETAPTPDNVRTLHRN